jgi:C_GCAxxG_C_C family probable redox protein
MTSQKDLLDEVYKRSFEYEARVGSCPQCVLAALKETLGVGDDSMFQASQGLTGGTSLSAQGTCGALAGGMMAISALVGRTYPEFSAGQRKRLVFKYTRKLFEKFIKEYGSPLCCDVQKKIFGRSYMLLDRQEYEAFEKAGAHVDKCTSVSGNTARWTAEIILNELLGEKKEG